jgi:hypothetical protein
MSAESALADHQYVSFIDVLTGMNLLHNVETWHNGRLQYLDELMQGGPEKLLKTIEIFYQWAAARGLRSEDLPPHASFIPRPPKYTASQYPVLEQAFRLHFVSTELTEKKLEKLREKNQLGGAAYRVFHREKLEMFAMQSGIVDGRLVDHAEQPGLVHGLRGPRPPGLLGQRRRGAYPPRYQAQQPVGRGGAVQPVARAL